MAQKILEAARNEPHELEKGDAALLYTDGLYEMANPRGERLTQRTLAQLLKPAGEGSAAAWLAEIIEKVSAHAQGEPFPDDIAALAMVRAEG